MSDKPTDRIIICEPRKDCADPHPHRWHCMRGFDEAGDGTPGVAGVCPLKVCERRGANRPAEPLNRRTT